LRSYTIPPSRISASGRCAAASPGGRRSLPPSSRASASSREGRWWRATGSIGVPLPFTDAEIVDIDDASRRLGVGEVGELAVKGPQVMLGYWNNEAETENVMTKDGWLFTGDIARMDADGYFYIVDRKKDMIDVSGLKVYPREVEELLFTYPGVKEAAVVGVPDDYRGEAVSAYIVLRPEAKGRVTEEEIVQFCRTNLATYKAPRKVTFVDELPKTLIGKVLRRKLREAGDASGEPAHSGAA
jgi:long-chain acyl-CoA synthetase